MPKVIVQGSKGLFQQSGTGFAFTDNQVEPSVETLTNQLIDLTLLVSGNAVDETNWGGKYISLFGQSVQHVFWFDIDSGSSQPSVSGANIKYHEVDLAAGAAVGAVETALAAKIEATNEFSVYSNAAGVYEIVGKTPYASGGAPSTNLAGGIVTALALTNAGSGSATKALSLSTEVSTINPCDPNLAIGATDAGVLTALGETGSSGAYTLADGTFVGQRKLIIVPEDIAATALELDITVSNLYDLSLDAQNNDTLVTKDNVASIIDLLWIGSGWVMRDVVATHTTSNSSATTGRIGIKSGHTS